mmetsp:Transcript_19286/g.41658  ORF Transcript_19286/g.41658 Transcript_19286/m.41658 type:complete len:386 (-) Transcript_19286:146-1303(-)
MFKTTLRAFLIVATLVGLASASSVHDSAGHDIAHAPAPAPISAAGLSATVVDGRRLKKKCKKHKEEHKTKKTKSSKSSKTKEKKTKKTDEKKEKKEKKEKECLEYESNRASMQTSCESDEELPVEELIVAYNYTIEVGDGDNINALMKDMENSVHETIVNDQLRCDDPVVRRRKLGGIRHSSSRGLFFGKDDDEKLKVVGTDPSPQDKPSKTNFCLIGVDGCYSINGFVTLLLEGEVTDEEEAAKEREATVSATRDSIKKSFRESGEKVYLVQKFGEARNNGYQSAQEEESSFSAGGAIAGAFAAFLVALGAAFVYKKKKDGAAAAGSREVTADAEGIPVASAKDLKGGKKDAVPVATVVEEMPVQESEDKSKLRFGFGKPAVPH